MKKIIIIALLSALAGCNTIAGVGQDITAGANTVADAI
ncbi:MAG: entericidin [Paracoccaceae bacterium]